MGIFSDLIAICLLAGGMIGLGFGFFGGNMNMFFGGLLLIIAHCEFRILLLEEGK